LLFKINLYLSLLFLIFLKVQKMHQAVLLIGGNLGDREKLIQQAHRLLSALGEITAASSLYETEAWGEASEGNFLNQALLLQTTKSPKDLLQATQAIENELGRTRELRWGNRTMDIDIIYFDDLVYQDEALTLPHPMLAERNFVLVPLVEILPDLIHPVFQLSQKELLHVCKDVSKVNVYRRDSY